MTQVAPSSTVINRLTSVQDGSTIVHTPNKIVFTSGATVTKGAHGEAQVACAGSFSGSGTTNTVPKFSGATALGNSAISDDGANVTITEPLILTGQTSTPGALAGTLSNAPATGNPQTWLRVSINGVVHFIPAWHV